MVRPAVPDPFDEPLWAGFRGHYGWDIGANCGQSITLMERACTKFTCFEPSPDSFAYARETYPAAHILQLAVSDHNGMVTLAYPAQEQKETGQLVTIGTQGMEWTPKDWAEAETVTVPCRTADSLAVEFGVPDLVKVDTEGHEAAVMAGAHGLVARGKTSWLIEFHSPKTYEQCFGLLEKAGYDPFVVRHPNYEPGSDMWFQHGWIRAFGPIA